MPRSALPMPSALLHRSVLASGAGKLQIRCAAPCRAISGRASVMRCRRSFRICILVNVESVKNFEESLLFSEAKAVIDADLRFDVLDRLPVAAV